MRYAAAILAAALLVSGVIYFWPQPPQTEIITIGPTVPEGESIEGPRFGTADEIIQPTTAVTDWSGWGPNTDQCYTSLSFTPTISGTISSTTITYGCNNFPSHNCTDSIVLHYYDDSSGSPGTSQVSETVAPSNGYALKYLPVTFSPAMSVTASTKYHLVFSRSGACDGNSYYQHYGSSSDVAGYDWKGSTDGSSWGDKTGTPNVLIQIDAVAATTPSDDTYFEILSFLWGARMI